MESLIDGSSVWDYDLVGFGNQSYNPIQNTFTSPQKGGTSSSASASSTQAVRHVTDKKIPVKSSKQVRRGSATQDTYNNEQDQISEENNEKETQLFDTFSGMIDGVTGQLLHGTRTYASTNEIYEGPFANNGLRHGDDAIVKNIQIESPYSTNNNNANGDDGHFLHFTKANFFGSYVNDEPHEGTLVTNDYTYKGTFVDCKFHGGPNCEIIHKSGYKFIGEFQDGLYHGMGREVYAMDKGEYKGEFRNGMKHGMGTYKGPVKTKTRSPPSPPPPSDTKVSDDNIHDSPPNNNYVDSSDDSDYDDDDKASAGVAHEENRNKQLDTAAKHSENTACKQIVHRYTHVGMYQCNKKHGAGTEFLTNGEIYDGEFKNNKRHGSGKLKDVISGITYEGQWFSGIPTASTFQMTYGSHNNSSSEDQGEDEIYIGQVSVSLVEDDNEETKTIILPHGSGVRRYITNNKKAKIRIYAGMWKEGKREGKGITIIPDKEDPTEVFLEIIGEWHDDICLSSRLKGASPTEDDSELLRTIGCDAYLLNLGINYNCDLNINNNSQNVTEEEEIDAMYYEDSDNDVSSHTRSSDIDTSGSRRNSLQFIEDAVAKSLNMDALSTSLEQQHDQQKAENKSERLPLNLPPGMEAEKGDTTINLPETLTTSNDRKTPPVVTTVLKTYENGDIFLGSIDKTSGLREGFGVYKSKVSGFTYMGQFVKNERHGYGKLYHPVKGTYTGYFQADRKHGLGLLLLNTSSKNNTKDSGNNHGEQQQVQTSNTSYSCPYNYIYYGYFNKGVYDGTGILIENNKSFIGEFKDGRAPPSQ